MLPFKCIGKSYVQMPYELPAQYNWVYETNVKMKNQKQGQKYNLYTEMKW